MRKLFKYKAFKHNNKEYSSNNLPNSRLKQFFSYFSDKKLLLFKLNLLTFIFFIPLIAWHFLSLGYISDIFSQDITQILNEYSTISLTVLGTSSLLLIILFIGLGGLFYVLKLLSHNEIISLWHDFFKGIKKNIKDFSLIGIITAILLYLISTAILYLILYMSVEGVSLLYLFFLISLIVILFVLVSIVLISLSLCTYYQMSISQLIKGSFKLFILKLPKYFLLLIITIIPLLLLLLSSKLIIIIIGYLLSLIFYLVLTGLLYNQISLGLFDELINKEQYPSIYKKGLKEYEFFITPSKINEKSVYDTIEIEDDFEIIDKE